MVKSSGRRKVTLKKLGMAETENVQSLKSHGIPVHSLMWSQRTAEFPSCHQKPGFKWVWVVLIYWGLSGSPHWVYSKVEQMINPTVRKLAILMVWLIQDYKKGKNDCLSTGTTHPVFKIVMCDCEKCKSSSSIRQQRTWKKYLSC